MADALEEEIIIIEESEVATLHDNDEVDASSTEDSDAKKKKLLFIVLGVAILFLIALLVTILLQLNKEPQAISMQTIEEKLDEVPKTKPIEPSKLEGMIAKADFLYSNGSKEEALLLYERIAQYSEAISNYNLGVAQLKNKQYALALETFKKAIKNDEKRCVSAINAAVCSLHLNNQESFRYYIDLAYAYLPNELESPLYSYYYALINYYNQNYIEVLSAIKNPTSEYYQPIQNHLSAKINALIDNDYEAIAAMEKSYTDDDAFSIALLYARVGDLVLATKYFQDAILRDIEPVKSQIALGLIYLKSGKLLSASKELKNITDMFPEEVYKPYPITVSLKDSLHDPEKAQLRLRNVTNETKELTYQKIFYFSPYKVFNAENTISYIRKGNANIYIDNITSAEEYFQKSASSSSVNKGIAHAIKKALSFKLHEANQELEKLVAIQPKHSILHYNLALTYAQLGDMPQAYAHFLRSYHLDAKNYLSGVFAVMTAQLINKEYDKMKTILKNDLESEESDENIHLYKTLLYMSENNILASAEWINNDYKQRPLYLALNIILATQLGKHEIAQRASEKLILLQPKDILPHIMYMETNFYDSKPKEYASQALNYLKEQKFHYEDLYYGPSITQYLYVQYNLLTGKLYFLRTQLKNVLETSAPKYPHQLISALALASLYDKAYEESYTLYNQLIDDLKMRDAKTLFLGATASIGAKHHENAIALLELSKLKDGSFLESRYALGLLYLEVKNNQGAVIQFGRVGDSGFNSQFFTFDIDLEKLLIEKNKITN